MLIRPWTENDRPFLRILFLHARRECWPWLDGRNWRLEDFDAATLNEQIWVAQENERPLGFASVWVNDNFLHHLFVTPEHHSRGIGHALLEKVQSEFSRTGALKCLVKNEHAVSFYQRHGWHIEAQGESDEGEYYLMLFAV